MSKMQVILVLVVLANTAFGVTPVRNPYYNRPTSHGCKKIRGISGLPLTTANVCDTRDACDIISKGAKCMSTALDRPFAFLVPAAYPMMICSSNECGANSPPTGLPGVLQCTPADPYNNFCECPVTTTAVYYCGICDSPPTSTCFCCSGKA